MKKAILDLTDCRDGIDMHQRFKKDLEFPDFYGENWDAFWDSLMWDTEVDYIEVHGERSVAKELLPKLETFHELLQKAKDECTRIGWEFDYVIVD